MANLNILFLFVITKNEGASFRLITHDRFPEDFVKSCEEPDWELPVEVEGNPCDELKTHFDFIRDLFGANTLTLNG